MVIWNHRAQVHISGLFQSKPMYSKAKYKYLHNTKKETHNFPIQNVRQNVLKNYEGGKGRFHEFGGASGRALIR